MFDHYAIKPIPIERPKITEMECKECEFLLDLEMIFEAACYGIFTWYLSKLESPKFFYKNLIQTDLLKEIDSFHTLPQSVYFMLFSIAIGSEDESSSIRATDLLLSLLSNHSGHPLSLNLCLPPSSVLCSTWSSFGMTGQHPLDLQTYCTNHPELTSVLLNDGSIDICIVLFTFMKSSFWNVPAFANGTVFADLVICCIENASRWVWVYCRIICSIYFSEQQLEDLLVNVMLILIDPRLIVLYDLICNLLAAIVMSMYKRGMYPFWCIVMCRKFTKAIQRIVSVEAIPKTNCLGLLLLRIPLVNPVLIVFRSVLSFYVLRRLQ